MAIREIKQLGGSYEQDFHYQRPLTPCYFSVELCDTCLSCSCDARTAQRNGFQAVTFHGVAL